MACKVNMYSIEASDLGIDLRLAVEWGPSDAYHVLFLLFECSELESGELAIHGGHVLVDTLCI